MELALFTPGAYIWPVYRNFEAFIAALGVPSADVDELRAGAVYPARQRTDSATHGLPPDLDQRLAKLHRDLRDALLRPVELFARQPLDFANYFWPDLAGTSTDQLLSAFVYYFVQHTARDLSVAAGLGVLRSVFFNHENVAPALWLQTAADRLATHRTWRNTRELQFSAPASSKHHNLAFVVAEDTRRPAGGPGWLRGRLQRQTDGTCRVTVEYALGPSLEGVLVPNEVTANLDRQARRALSTVFGWVEEAAA